MKKISLFIVLSLLFVFCGCDTNLTQGHRFNNSLNFEEEKMETIYISDFMGSDEKKYNSNIDDKFDIDYKINKDFLYKKNDVIVKNEIEYKNFSFYKSKKLPKSVKKDNFIYFTDDCNVDTNGTIKDNNSYLFISMDVTNRSKNNIMLCWYLSINLVDEYDDFFYPRGVDENIPSLEARYNNLKNNSQKNKDYFIKEIGSNETVSVVVGFILSDKYINDNMLCFAPESCDTESVLEYNKAKFIWINR